VSATNITLADAAISYARAGWPVHPLKRRDKIPASPHGCKDATFDADRIREWWEQIPDANIGIATGHGFFVVDLDGPAAALWADANELPDTLTAITAKGRHLFYALPPNTSVRNSAGQVAPGVDIRGAGGYVVAPPSVHPSGHVYQWLDLDEPPSRSLLTAAPDWLLALVATSERRQPSPQSRFSLPPSIRKGTQHTTLFRYASSLRARGIPEDEILNRVLRAAQTCEEIPPDLNVRRIVEWVISRYSPNITLRKSDSTALTFPNTNALTSSNTASLTSPDISHDDDGSGNPKIKPNAIADAILADHRVINVDGLLYEYGVTHWQQITTERLKSLAAERDGSAWTTQRRRAEVADFIRATTYRRTQQWRLLQPWEVAVGNGVVDLRSDTLTLRPHDPEDYLQACVPVPLQPAASAGCLMRCLDTYFGGDDDGEAKKLALQEFFGYCLMSHARYKKALLCYGESNCGKSTIPFLLRELVGAENMCAVSVQDMDDPRKRAPLRGKLINALTELPTDAMIADGGFKTLVSTEEPIQFDEKFLPAIMDIPIAKHVIVTNNLPAINDRSRGTFNRLLLIQFNHVIPESEQNKKVWDELRNEIEGILLWALEGAQRLYQRDGRFTSAGAAQIEEYRNEQNPVLEWINEACERDPEARVFVTTLRESYCRWAGKTVSPKFFVGCLKSAGFEITPNPVWINLKKGRAVMGVRLI
jgi:putative DNA primase/helicase